MFILHCMRMLRCKSLFSMLSLWLLFSDKFILHYVSAPGECSPWYWMRFHQSIWFIKIWKVHSDHTQLFYWGGLGLSLVLFHPGEGSGYSILPFSLLNHKSHVICQRRTCQRTGKRNAFRHQSETHNWKAAWRRYQGHGW